MKSRSELYCFKSISIRYEVIYRRILDKCQWTDWLIGCHGIRCIAGCIWIMDLWSVVHPDTLFVSTCSCRQTSADYTWQTGFTRRWHTFPPATQDVASPVILEAAACRTFTRWQHHSLLDTLSLGNVGVAALWQMPSKCDILHVLNWQQSTLFTGLLLSD